MATSTDVTLPRKVVPVFPECCLVCTESTDSKIHVTHHSQNPIAVFFAPFLFLFGWSRIKIPICHHCRVRFFVQRWGRTVILWTVLAVAFAYVAPNFAGWQPLTRKIAIAACCILIGLPYIAYEVFFPRAFDTTANFTTTTYEFRSMDVGLQFYSLNKEAHPYVKIDLTLGD